MLKYLIRKVARPARKFFGTEGIASNVEQEMDELRREALVNKLLLEKAISYLEFVTIDHERMRDSNKFKNANEIISLLSPMDVLEGNYRRIGRNGDGGYVMLDDFSSRRIDAAYSFGISNDVSWDEEIANLGIDVYMYDHTIENLPKDHPRFHFFREGVTGESNKVGLNKLSAFLIRNGHQNSDNLILKMDIEGYEWSVFEETPSSVIRQFSQISIELHGLDPGRSNSDLCNVLSVLRKINLTHQAVHVHANGSCPVCWLGELVLPQLLEVTYIRRTDYQDRLIENTREFPTENDQPTLPWLPEVPLGRFFPTNIDETRY